MKPKLLFAAALLGLIAFKTFAPPSVVDETKLIWLTDYKKALETARTEKKAVLMDFTGSDWCGWCIKLRREVFATVEFQNYAATNLVLLEVDFPQRKSQSAALKKQNEELMQKFGVEGFPTIIILNSEGKALGKTGYVPGGPQPFIKTTESIRTRS